MSRQLIALAMLCLAAAVVVPGAGMLRDSDSPGVHVPASDAPAPWDDMVTELNLQPVTLSAKEIAFYDRFPGRIGSYSDGSSNYIFREVLRPTRKLHRPETCFRANGWATQPASARVDGDGLTWGSFRAERDGVRVRVFERITCDSGRTWYDIPSWFWSAVLAPDEGPWFATTLIEQE